MKVGIIQLEINDDESPKQRLQRVDALLENMKVCDLILLPEMWMTGYFSFDHYVCEAQSIDGEFVTHYSNMAKKLNAYLYAGSFVELKGGEYFNTSVFFDRNGALTGVYRKIHLFRYGSLEGKLLTRGKKTTVVDTEFGKIGLATCYDLRFPELFRKELELGAQIFLITSAWPLSRIDHWKIFNQARALENQCYLISCNCVGTTRKVQLGGHSSIVNPLGIVEKYAQANEDILYFDIDTSKVAQIREEFPQIKHIVPID
ncbi:carbon-nitrogen family hydrolase [Rummeliibacillus sp. SL167]|uniref:carbon-nitrogen family hydrolase n=1 Tax=Rummeliibacillus sp. SL167 TaxID=2579792 RepID=UPI0011B3C8D0|nr:carbon-nitrogen family hydrolase [Rummeliibacillus sp. SL167]